MAKSRGRYKTDQDPVSWIGEKQSWEDAADPQFTYKIADFYT